ncbi:ATP-binding protein [Riemerella anatipestifer]
MSKKAHFKIDPKLAELLGETYRSTEDALKELIDNAYDADSENVKVTLPEILDNEPTIKIEDDGTGMKENELRTEYLKIASSRFVRKGATTNLKNRPVKGRKGIGKFSGLMVAEIMEVITKAGGKQTTLIIVKSELAKQNYELDKIDLPINVVDCDKDEHGTTVILRGINQNYHYPNPEKLKQILVWDYGRVNDFNIYVNDEKIGIQDFNGTTIEKEFSLDEDKKTKIIYTISDKPVKQPGLIYRVGGKIIGKPENF